MSESVLCAFVAGLAQQGLTPGTIRTYLAAVRHAQIVRGFPEPREQSSLPRLRLLQNGVRRDRAESGRATPRPRLPITPPILRRMRAHLVTGSGSGPEQADGRMLWAASVACFFGFFRAGELTVPARTAFDPRVHLAWGDVTRDGGQPPAWVRIFLKRSKTDQFGRGVAVYVGTTGDELCPVTALLDYVTVRGVTPGPFFPLSRRGATDESPFCDWGAGRPRASGHPLPAVLLPQLPDRGGDRGGGSGRRGLDHPGARQVVKLRLSDLH